MSEVALSGLLSGSPARRVGLSGGLFVMRGTAVSRAASLEWSGSEMTHAGSYSRIHRLCLSL